MIKSGSYSFDGIISFILSKGDEGVQSPSTFNYYKNTISQLNALSDYIQLKVSKFSLHIVWGGGGGAWVTVTGPWLGRIDRYLDGCLVDDSERHFVSIVSIQLIKYMN